MVPRPICAIWLSDLHIGGIFVLEGANLTEFENESRAALISPARWMKRATGQESYVLSRIVQTESMLV